MVAMILSGPQHHYTSADFANVYVLKEEDPTLINTHDCLEGCVYAK